MKVLQRLTLIMVMGSFALFAASAHASQIRDLSISGTDYDVTFWEGNETFTSLWDGNGDGTFVDGTLDKQPEFWLNFNGAIAARDAIIVALNALGDNGVTVPGFDGFIIPFQFFPPVPSLVNLTLDADPALEIDVPLPLVATPSSHAWNRNLPVPPGYAWTSFERSAVPLPSSPALLLAGLLAAEVTRRIRRPD